MSKGKMISIKINEKQPVECPKCKASYGYQYSDYMKMHYTSYHSSDGIYESGTYSDGYMLTRGTTPYCSNCRTRLAFKLIREKTESV